MKRREVLTPISGTRFKRSIEEGDPSLKALMPELFPPVKIKNGVLVNKDGDPVKDFPGGNYRVINHKHESFPMLINEDGTIRLPTLKEMEQMRAKGDVRLYLSRFLAAPWIWKWICHQQNLRQTIRRKTIQAKKIRRCKRPGNLCNDT